MSAHCDLLTRRTARAELALEDTLIQSQHVSIMAKQTQDEDTGTHKYRLPQNIENNETGCLQPWVCCESTLVFCPGLYRAGI
ncbi:hypothetical protein F2P79_002326 [Pimephales promelas]|nr:hypothetical protein F2P79_002326 [Pimephales promelas]